MNDNRIRIYPKRREVDTERLAMALLDLVAKLSPEDKIRFVAGIRKETKEVAEGTHQKGSAA